MLKAAREEICCQFKQVVVFKRNIKNKKQLSPKQMGKLFTAAFQMYPKTQKETEKDAWAECVKAIDVVNRALNHKRIT